MIRKGLVQISREIEMEWPELGVKIVATLADDKNPGLCNVLWNNLPIETIQSHSGCSGEMMYAFHGIVSFVKPEYVEDYTDKKYWGKVPFSWGVINLHTLRFQVITVTWGKERYEPGKMAPVGFVKKEHLEKLHEVGETVLEGMFTGKYYQLIIRRKE